MDFAAIYRGGEVGRRRESCYFTVVLIGEVLNVPCHPLFPVAPARELPFALLPICNTPIIDYILENFAENGVNEVNILLNSESVNPVRSHLQSNNRAREKPWLKSKGMHVNIVESGKRMQSLFDAVSVIREQNVVKQKTSFLFAPIDTIAFFTDLCDLFQTHLRRTKEIKGYKSTLLCTSVRSAFENTLHDVLVKGVKEQALRSSSVVSERDKPFFSRLVSSLGDVGLSTAPKYPPNHLTMFLLDRFSGVVRNMMRFEPNKGGKDRMGMKFDEKKHISLRTDLLLTNFFFCSDNVFLDLKPYVVDQHDFCAVLLEKYEVSGEFFGVEVVPPSKGIVRQISSLEAYIQANIDVCCRRFFPLTCESGFAENLAEYAVSPHCQSVYLHRKNAKVLSNDCEPCVVVGENVVVPQETVVRCTVLGRGVQIGEGSEVISCVLLDGTRVGRGCVLHHSFIGYRVVLGDGTQISNSVIGSGCVIGTLLNFSTSINSFFPASSNNNNNNNNSGNTTNNNDNKFSHLKNVTNNVNTITVASDGDGVDNSNDKNPEGVVILNQAVVYCEDTEMGEISNICYKVLNKQYTSSIAPTREIFVHDLDPREGEQIDETADDEGRKDDSTFRREVVSLVDRGLEDPSLMVNCVFEMKDIRLSFKRKNFDLCRVVTERLLKYVLEQYKDKKDSVAAMKALNDLFAQWCRPFYMDVATGNAEMRAVLEAACAAISNESCLLFAHSEEVIESLHIGCDEELHEERGYCIISSESLVEFADYMLKLKEQHSRAINGRGKSENTYGNNTGGGGDSNDVYDDNYYYYYDDDDDDDDDDGDDIVCARAKGVLRVLSNCLSYIDEVRAFLKEESEENGYE